MSYEIVTIPHFDKELKKLAKKYPSLKADLYKVIESIKQKPIQGTSLGSNCYKIRIAIASKGKGKSGGARLITHIKIIDQRIYFLSIYDKSKVDSITNKELELLLQYLD